MRGSPNVIEASLRSRERQEGDHHDVYLLTPVGETDGMILLPQPIRHETWKHHGAAWTRKHRYVTLAALEASPATTDELEAAEHAEAARFRAAAEELGLASR